MQELRPSLPNLHRSLLQLHRDSTPLRADEAFEAPLQRSVRQPDDGAAAVTLEARVVAGAADDLPCVVADK